MARSEEAKSKGESQAFCCNFTIENCEGIFKKMQDCCSDKGTPVDCCVMIRGIFGNTPQETDKK